MNLAMTLMQMGKRNEALAQLQRAMVTTHGDTVIRDALARFQSF